MPRFLVFMRFTTERGTVPTTKRRLSELRNSLPAGSKAEVEYRILEQACRHNLEGIVAKRKDGAYLGTDPDWLDQEPRIQSMDRAGGALRAGAGVGS